MMNFENMTKEEAIDYCYLHADEYKADIYKSGEDGHRLFECLIVGLESGAIQPRELADYGMYY